MSTTTSLWSLTTPTSKPEAHNQYCITTTSPQPYIHNLTTNSLPSQQLSKSVTLLMTPVPQPHYDTSNITPMFNHYNTKFLLQSHNQSNLTTTIPQPILFHSRNLRVQATSPLQPYNQPLLYHHHNATTKHHYPTTTTLQPATTFSPPQPYKQPLLFHQHNPTTSHYYSTTESLQTTTITLQPTTTIPLAQPYKQPPVSHHNNPTNNHHNPTANHH